MNRHQRRAAAAQARSSAAAAGRESAKSGQMPPGYVDDIRKIARLIVQWVAEQPSPPHLVWHDMVAGPAGQNTLLIGPMRGEALKYVAGSPDAIRCLEWVDEQSGGVGTLYQATWALKIAGFLPLPPELDPLSGARDGYSTALRFARSVHDERNRHAPSPCAHCGKVLDASGGGPDGVRPYPGALSVCVYCQGVNQYGDDLALQAVDVDSLPEETRNEVRDVQAMLRQAVLRGATGARGNRADA